MRDAQQSRVYASESPIGRRFDSVAEMQAYVDKLTASAWWKKNVRRPATITVTDGRRRRMACGGRNLDGTGYVKMPRWSRTESVLLHEIAHTIHPWAKHGPRWAGAYLGLLDRQLGRDVAEGQMAAFRERQVDWKLPEWWRRPARRRHPDQRGGGA